MKIRWSSLPAVGSPFSTSSRGLGTGASYFTAVSQILALFRFFTFAMGVSLLLVIDPPDEAGGIEFLIVMVAGVFNVVRLAWRFNPARHNLWVSWATLVSDAALSITLVVLTRGLDSPFLIYSLAPVLSASLLLDARRALFVAAAAALSVPGAYVAGELGLGQYPWILEGNYLAFSLLYLAVCFLMAYLPFLANLNWHSRLEAEARDSERARLRREVHDSVAQTLAFLSLKMRWAEDKAARAQSGEPAGALRTRDMVEVRSMVERAYLSVRDFLDASQDPEGDRPLVVSLRSMVGQWSSDTGLEAEVRWVGGEPDLEATTKFHITQIAREALANVAKHASPCRAEVAVEFDGNRLTLSVSDDGRGFSPSQPRGHGLGIMAERAAIVGAEVSVDSTPGRGTTVVLAYPAIAEEA